MTVTNVTNLTGSGSGAVGRVFYLFEITPRKPNAATKLELVRAMSEPQALRTMHRNYPDCRLEVVGEGRTYA